MTQKEKIIEILKSYADYHYLPEIERAAYVVGDHSFNDIADAILAMPIDVPTDQEIEDYCLKENHGNTRMGAKWAIEEIIKRNQK